MELKDAYLVPMIGFGGYDETLTLENKGKWKIRTIIILFIKLQFYKRIE